jgi:A/G-specific adenine glycosylase
VAPALSAAARTRLRRRVLGWYAANGRPLAFRATSDPWAILVSEVMAQQTQAGRAAEAWSRFSADYPTPAALASAHPAAVLRAWRGLGYNRRAVALQRAAQAIVRDHGGEVPRDLEALLRLPGVGPYTTRAVAALAFGQRVGAVDTNVRRVLSRAFFEGPAGQRDMQALADELAPPRHAGLWTHALMDIGATFCRARAPRCEPCPFNSSCRYAADRSAAAPPARSTPAQPARPTRRPSTSFEGTSRWLRGRILDRLRDLDDGAWLPFGEAIGQHDAAAVAVALEGLARDGLIERRDGDAPEARLPHR